MIEHLSKRIVDHDPHACDPSMLRNCNKHGTEQVTRTAGQETGSVYIYQRNRTVLVKEEVNENF